MLVLSKIIITVHVGQNKNTGFLLTVLTYFLRKKLEIKTKNSHSILPRILTWYEKSSVWFIIGN